MSLIEIQRYFIVVLESKLVSLHNKRKKKSYEKIFFCERKSFEQSIQLLAKHLSVFWAATNENFDFFLFLFSEKKTIVLQFPYMEIV